MVSSRLRITIPSAEPSGEGRIVPHIEYVTVPSAHRNHDTDIVTATPVGGVGHAGDESPHADSAKMKQLVATPRNMIVNRMCLERADHNMRMS
jgi:hypothetical protein